MPIMQSTIDNQYNFTLYNFVSIHYTVYWAIETVDFSNCKIPTEKIS